MAHLIYHTTNGRGVLTLHNLLHAPESQTPHRGAHIPGAANKAAHPLEFHCFALFFCHDPTLCFYRSSSTDLERNSATRLSSFKRKRASKVALMTLCGFEVPIDFVNTFEIPATSITARTGPPAMMPVPSDAGLSRTCPEP